MSVTLNQIWSASPAEINSILIGQKMELHSHRQNRLEVINLYVKKQMLIASHVKIVNNPSFNQLALDTDNLFQIIHSLSRGECFTITFSEVIENHVGMQQLGTKALTGFSTAELQGAVNYFSSVEYASKDNSSVPRTNIEIYNLNDYLPEGTKCAEIASVVIIRNAIKGSELEGLTNEMNSIRDQVDKQAFMKGRVVNKLARWNLCFADIDQDPNIAEKQGTVINFNRLPTLNSIRRELSSTVNRGMLLAELNYYYDINKCGIGKHGDKERSLVMGLRVGEPMSLIFQWYHKSNPISQRIDFILNSGDVYYMSEKTTGNDWMCSSKITLRHAAGCDKYIS